MRRYYHRAKSLAFSSTAKDTYILFAGNVGSAFTGFLFTLLIARGLSVSDFGIFSAVANLVVIISSVTDLGITSGMLNFAAKYFSKKKETSANRYVNAAFLIRLITITFICLFIVSMSKTVSQELLATSDPVIAVWVAVISFFSFVYFFSPFIMQAKKKFIQMALIENSLGGFRLVVAVVLYFGGFLTLASALGSYLSGAIFTVIFSFFLTGIGFLKERPEKKTYKKLIFFSGWLGVNKVISSISGRLDVQMLASLAGATATGFYSIPSRLSLFVVVLASSLGSVMSPRFASFSNQEQEKKYLLKGLLALVPIIGGIVIWILIAKPFILILFGQKYLPAVPVFQALTASMIPFLISIPPVQAIVFSMKKPVYIGVFSIFQLVAIFLLNLLFIPKYGPIGPTITFGIVHAVMAIYTWVIVYRNYWKRRYL